MGANAISSICWECAKSAGECSWSSNFTPVNGWKVHETTDTHGEVGYFVLDCPEFVKEIRGRKELDTDGCVTMIEKLLEITHEDYILGGEETEKEIERFLRGRGASRVHRIANPEAVIRKLKDDKEKFWEEQKNEQADNHRKLNKRP